VSEDTGAVLVVDDTATRRPVVSEWLRAAGYPVVEVATATEALRRLDAEPVELVLTSVKLPDMSAAELCDRIKSTRTDIAVIQVSPAEVSVAERASGMGHGPDAYLAEPVEPDALLATVRAVLRHYGALRRAERLAARMARLAVITQELNTARSIRELLRIAAHGASAIFDAPAMVFAETPDGIHLSVASPGPDAIVRFRPWTAELFDVPSGTLLRDLPEPPAEWPRLAWPGGRVRVVGARLRHDRGPAYVATPAEVSDEGSPVMTQLAVALVASIDVLRAYQDEHRLALTLQRSLLPSRLPAVPGYEFAVRYVPASYQAEIGGDFYELSLVGDRLAVAVGDVAGHSLHAATVMAELRHATRAYLAEGHAPGAVLERLNQLLIRLIPDEMATLCLLLVDPATGVAQLANAGHPPPLLSHDGRVTFVTERSAPLGVRGVKPVDGELTIPPAGTLVLYSDGLVERRAEHIDRGLAALARVAAVVDSDLDELCDRLLAEVGPAEPQDDIAVLALRRSP
jgi:DNA-binding response OmpR family regulator